MNKDMYHVLATNSSFVHEIKVAEGSNIPREVKWNMEDDSKSHIRGFFVSVVQKLDLSRKPYSNRLSQLQCIWFVSRNHSLIYTAVWFT
jgi:hypothetical protein